MKPENFVSLTFGLKILNRVTLRIHVARVKSPIFLFRFKNLTKFIIPLPNCHYLHITIKIINSQTLIVTIFYAESEIFQKLKFHEIDKMNCFQFLGSDPKYLVETEQLKRLCRRIDLTDAPFSKRKHPIDFLVFNE